MKNVQKIMKMGKDFVGLGKTDKTIGGMNPLKFFNELVNDPDHAFELMTDEEFKMFEQDPQFKVLKKKNKPIKNAYKKSKEKRNL